MARVLLSFLRRDRTVVGFCADDAFVKDSHFMGLPVTKFSERETTLPAPSAVDVAVAIGYHGMNRVRAERYETLLRDGYAIAAYIDPTVIRHEGVLFGQGVIVYDGTAIHAGSCVGNNVFISSNVGIGHDCVIHDHAWINSGVALGGGVIVGERCFIGMNATIGHGVNLGEATFVGAGAVVTRDTPAGEVIVAPESVPMNVESDRFMKLLELP